MNQLDIHDFSNFWLVEIVGNQHLIIPYQIEENKQLLFWILSGLTKKDSIRTFELITGQDEKIGGRNAAAETVEVVNDDNGLRIKAEGKNVLQYNSLPVPLPDGVDSAYKRGAFIHPLWSPSGQVLTQIQPQDHYHHVGIWNPWTKTTFEDREIDFWNLVKKQGTVRFRNLESTQSGNVFGGFSVNQEHIDLTAPGGEMVVMNEKWEVKVYQPGDNPYYIVDFTSV
ncbi:MAG: PmoA family protein, partial [Bacteroidales bacterium]|nr:PmoA family protein [Bacteroidales bacterium]